MKRKKNISHRWIAIGIILIIVIGVSITSILNSDSENNCLMCKMKTNCVDKKAIYVLCLYDEKIIKMNTFSDSSSVKDLKIIEKPFIIKKHYCEAINFVVKETNVGVSVINYKIDSEIMCKYEICKQCERKLIGYNEKPGIVVYIPCYDQLYGITTVGSYEYH